jgi:CheY-like chemotaxis protein
MQGMECPGRVVWLIDDDPLMLRLGTRQLRSPDAEVRAFGSPVAALGALAEALPDAVVIDQQMPQLDGLATGRRMREAGFSGPMVLWTATESEQLWASASAAGFDGLFTKSTPLNMAILDQVRPRLPGERSREVA